MPRYRVGEGGVRILPERGAPYSLPPGAVLDELPDRYEGTLEAIEWERMPRSEPAPPATEWKPGPVSTAHTDWKRVPHYDTKVIRPAEDKSQ